MDINCLSYLALIGFLLVFFHKEVRSWPLYVLAHVGAIVIILEILRSSEKYSHDKILLIVRTFYPMAVVLFCWNEIDALVRMFYGTFWATDAITMLDKLVFGVHPTVWAQQFYRPWLDELMNLFYSGYYLFMPLVTLTFFLKGRHEETLAAFSFGTFTYLSNYVWFFILPTLGPQMIDGLEALRTSQSTGYAFAEITRSVQATGGITGGAFPSSHVSGALTWSLVALRFRLKIRYVLIPMVLGVAISAVYLGYHHALDPLCGLVWGAICYKVSSKLIKTRGEDPLIS
jgi:membrane-associated phospholipid phosphatase